MREDFDEKCDETQKYVIVSLGLADVYLHENHGGVTEIAEITQRLLTQIVFKFVPDIQVPSVFAHTHTQIIIIILSCFTITLQQA